MNIYKSKIKQLSGTSYSELIKHARSEYHSVQKKTPRRIPYVRSAYFTKDKIFINNFWDHLSQKAPKERVRRLKLYAASIDLLRHSTTTPESMQNPNNKDENLHRFSGKTADNVKYYVQIKENKRTNRKDFISCFPAK